MSKSKHTEAQMIAALNRLEAGRKTEAWECCGRSLHAEERDEYAGPWAGGPLIGCESANACSILAVPHSSRYRDEWESKLRRALGGLNIYRYAGDNPITSSTPTRFQLRRVARVPPK